MVSNWSVSGYVVEGWLSHAGSSVTDNCGPNAVGMIVVDGCIQLFATPVSGSTALVSRTGLFETATRPSEGSMNWICVSVSSAFTPPPSKSGKVSVESEGSWSKTTDIVNPISVARTTTSSPGATDSYVASSPEITGGGSHP